MEVYTGHRLGTVPVTVEHFGDRRHDRTGREQIQVQEVVIIRKTEIGIRDISPPGNNHAVIGDEHLVVQTVVEFPQAQQEIQIAT